MLANPKLCMTEKLLSKQSKYLLTVFTQAQFEDEVMMHLKPHLYKGVAV